MKRRLVDGHNEQIYGRGHEIRHKHISRMARSALFVSQKSEHFISTRQAIKILEADSCYSYEI